MRYEYYRPRRRARGPGWRPAHTQRVDRQGQKRFCVNHQSSTVLPTRFSFNRVRRRRMRRSSEIFLAIMTVLGSATVVMTGPASAGPTVDEIAPPLPVIAPAPTDWVPKFPFPYDQTRGSVTDAEITAH